MPPRPRSPILEALSLVGFLGCRGEQMKHQYITFTMLEPRIETDPHSALGCCPNLNLLEDPRGFFVERRET